MGSKPEASDWYHRYEAAQAEIARLEDYIVVLEDNMDYARGEIERLNAVVEAGVRDAFIAGYKMICYETDPETFIDDLDFNPNNLDRAYKEWRTPDKESCAKGHDFRPYRGSAKCRDCGELADCTETGAVLAALETDDD